MKIERSEPAGSGLSAGLEIVEVLLEGPHLTFGRFCAIDHS